MSRSWNEPLRLAGGFIDMSYMMRKGWRVFFAAVVLLMLPAAACGDAGFQPIHGFGNVLTITVADVERFPELRYTTQTRGRVLNHFRLAPAGLGNEIVAVRIQVRNDTAVNAIVTLDQDAAELQDFFGGVYLPLDIGALGEVWTRSGGSWRWVSNAMAAEVPVYAEGENVPAPPGWGDIPVRYIELDGTTAKDGGGFLAGSVEMPKGTRVDGWMVFEAPEGIEFNELQWRAADSIRISF